MIWCRVAGAAVWTDGAARYAFSVTDTTDFNEYVTNYKSNLNNRYDMSYVANAVTDGVAITPFSPTDWFCCHFTWTKAAPDQVEAFIDGATQGTSGVLGVWAGNITRAIIGAASTAPASVWHGWLAHCAIWNHVLTGEIVDLAVVQ